MAKYADGTVAKVGDLVVLSGPITVEEIRPLNHRITMVRTIIDGYITWFTSTSLRCIEPPVLLEPKRPKLPAHPYGEWRYMSDEKQPLPKYGPFAFVLDCKEQDTEISVDSLLWCTPGEECPFAGELRWIVEFVPKEASNG